MKVLFITYPMAFHTPGGGEVQLLAYKKALEDKGVQVDLFNPWEPNFLEYDVVHYFSCVGGSVHICNFIKNLGIPLVITSSLWITEETKNLYPIDEIRCQLSLANAIVTNSNIESDELAKVIGVNRDKFYTVYNGVEDMFFDGISASIFRDRFGIHDDFILNVGNIEPRKNQLNLVKAMKKFPDRKLVLIGHVRDKNYYSQVEKEANEEQLIYIGSIKHDSELLRSAYSAASVFCLPSTLETPGLAAIEALACKCTCSITNVGSTVEYFGDSISDIDPQSVDSIAKSIEKNLSKIEKHELSVNEFRWSKVIEKLIMVYEDVHEKRTN